MSNPLLEQHLLPPFSRILPEHVEPAITELIARNKTQIDALLDEHETYTRENLLLPIEALEDELAQAWSPVSHLNSVRNSDELRAAYNACLPLLSEYGTWLGQHRKLFEAYRQLRDSDAYAGYEAGQQKAIDNALRDFRLAGVDLPAEQQARYAQIKQRLSELGSKFGENVLDATNAWRREATEEELDGLPGTALASAREAARAEGLDGYLITLDYPSYAPVLMYCHNRALREEIYTANATRASDQGPDAGKWDNAPLIDETLQLRHELAQVLGFEHYADYSLATKMAQQPEQVLDFLHDLAERSLPQARQEWQALVEFAADEDGPSPLQAWDVGYYSERLRQARYAVSQEDIRPYLPVDRVLPGLFEVAQRLYGITIEPEADIDSYHEDVQLFTVSHSGEPVARFYLDLYARAHKRGGAWMDDCRIRREVRNGVQLPVAYLVCNFTAPVGDSPSLLTHNELTTLFHEFGHGLHHMLTRQTVAAISGINGVAWDAVELPSQFLENWCWEPEALAFISGHHETGEPIPGALLEKMLAARNFQSAMGMARQLEFALFDFRLHCESHLNEFTSVQALLDEVRSAVSVVPAPAFNRFQTSFSHIFAGGYAAGYYSYKWAEVLSADAFSRFEQEGIFNAATGEAFKREILETGGSRDPMDTFVAFMGREPTTDALLRHSGIGG
jgi:oligopeptidase A